MRAIVAFLASTGLALVSASVFANIASYLGMLFGGLETVFAVVVTTVTCAIVAPVTAEVLKSKNKHFGWKTLLFEVTLLTFVAVSLLSIVQTRKQMQIFLNPAPVPNSVNVHHGRSLLFSSYVHFQPHRM